MKIIKNNIPGWIYWHNDPYYRFVLGEPGRNNIVCIGINPSSAMPNRPDPTILKVKAIMKNNDYDGYIMMNLHPYRGSEPNDINNDKCYDSLEANIRAFKEIFDNENYHKCDICVLWGAIDNKVRGHAKILLKKQMLAIKPFIEQNESKVYCLKLLKGGHPGHPLYLPNNVRLKNFDYKEYLYNFI